MPDSKLSSIMNERTLEFALVPVVQAALEDHFDRAAPIYFWKSREGNCHSLSTHRERPVRLLALFGRRPKMTAGGAVIEGKLNHQLLEFAKQAHKLGIASIAGFSPVTALFDLTKDPTMYWILLWQVKQDDGWGDVLFRPVPTTGEETLIGTNRLPLPVVSTADILIAVHNTSNVMPFATAVEAMSQLRSALSGDRGFFPWWGSHFDNGVLNGPFEFLDDQDNTLRQVTFENGSIVKDPHTLQTQISDTTVVGNGPAKE